MATPGSSPSGLLSLYSPLLETDPAPRHRSSPQAAPGGQGGSSGPDGSAPGEERVQVRRSQVGRLFLLSSQLQLSSTSLCCCSRLRSSASTSFFCCSLLS